MVSLTAIEAKMQAIWPDVPQAVVAVPDKKKGEQLVLFTTLPKLERKPLADALKREGATDLMIPKTILHVEALPLLGSGKTDYVQSETAWLWTRLWHKRPRDSDESVTMRLAKIAERVEGLGSDKWAVHVEGKERRVAGEELIFLSIGEPDLPPAPAILDVAARQMKAGRTKYSGGNGEQEMLETLGAFYTKQTGRRISADSVHLPARHANRSGDCFPVDH